MRRIHHPDARALAEHYGFTDEELDFIMSAPANDDSTHRMGCDGLAGDDAGAGGDE